MVGMIQRKISASLKALGELHMIYQVIAVVGALVVFGSFLYVVWELARSLKQ